VFVDCSGDFGETCGRGRHEGLFSVQWALRAHPLPVWTTALCSQRCVNKYKSDTERKISRIKEWTIFLAQKNIETDMLAQSDCGPAFGT
jgi:hypothetical protein